MCKFMGQLLIISIFFACENTYALTGFIMGQGCPSTVKNNHLVISFEGLGNMGVNQTAISNRFQSIGYTPANYPHIGIGAAVQCATKWKQTYRDLKISITGHSCGGSAAIETAKILGRSNIRVASVMTIDPACIVRPLYRYQKPNNVDQLINFTGGVGFRVSGGLNCHGGGNHIGMPNNSRVQNLAKIMLSGYTVMDCNGNYSAPQEPSYYSQNEDTSTTYDSGTGNAETGERVPAYSNAPATNDSKYGNATPEQIKIMKKYGLVHRNPNQPAKGCRQKEGCTWLKASLEQMNQPSPGER